MHFGALAIACSISETLASIELGTNPQIRDDKVHGVTKRKPPRSAIGDLSSPVEALALLLFMHLPQLADSHQSSRRARVRSSVIDGHSEGVHRATERYLILRHGQSDFNSEGIMQGSSDISRLTSMGENQARDAGSQLAMLKDVPIKRVFVSPLTRATATLDLLTERLGYQLPQRIVLPDLREVDLYSWEGRSKADIMQHDSESYAAWKRNPSVFSLDGHRPVVELWHRARSVFQTMRSTNTDVEDGVTLVVCHGKIGQALVFHALGLDVPYFRNLSFPNTGAVELEWPLHGLHATHWRWRLPMQATENSEWRNVSEFAANFGTPSLQS